MISLETIKSILKQALRSKKSYRQEIETLKKEVSTREANIIALDEQTKKLKSTIESQIEKITALEIRQSKKVLVILQKKVGKVKINSFYKYYLKVEEAGEENKSKDAIIIDLNVIEEMK